MSQPFIGEIRCMGFNFAPRGWSFCDGQIMPINQNTALFSILGTNYGGNGQTTYGLPDLRGRAVMGPGDGPGLSNHELGEKSGSESVTLTAQNIPAHTHRLFASNSVGNTNSPAGAALAIGAKATPLYAPASGASTTPMQAQTLAATGSGQAHNNMQPYIAMNFVISLQGVYPSRN